AYGLFVLLTPRPPPSPLFPYTTLFRSRASLCHVQICSGGGDATAGCPHQCWRHSDSRSRWRLVFHPTGDFASRGRGLGDRILPRSEEHTSELQSRGHLVCRLLLEKKKR